MTSRHRSNAHSSPSGRRKPPQVTEALRQNLGELREQAAEQATALTQGLRLRSQDVIGESKPSA